MTSTPTLAVTLVALLLPCLVALGGPPTTLLVVMSRSGTVEGYDLSTGKHQGVLIRGLHNPNGVVVGPDGDLYISGGPIGGPGYVKRFDSRTGAPKGDFVAFAKGQPGFLARGTGVAFHGGDLFVASCEDGKVLRFDGAAGAYKADFASASPGGITQIAFHDGALYLADFHTCAIRKHDGATGAFLGNVTTRPGFSPWGVAFSSDGAMFWSGSDHTIQRWDGSGNQTWAGPGPGLDIPLRLAMSPDDRLFCSHWAGNTVTVWSTKPPRPAAPLMVLKGPEVRGPIGLAFSSDAVPPRPPIAVLQSRGQAVVRLEVDPAAPQLLHLGWDTEGGDRARHNLLQSPAELRLKLAAKWACPPAAVQLDGPSGARYALPVGDGPGLDFAARTEAGRLSFTLSGHGPGLSSVGGIEFALPFDPKLCATTVIASDWSSDGKARLPFIISAPDLGAMLVTCPERPRLEARVEGSRAEQWVTVTFELPTPKDAESYTLQFAPVILPTPVGLAHDRRWLQARRGWFNLLQVSAKRTADGPYGDTPGGLWANNVISDPVSSVLWMLSDHALLVPELAPGVPVAPLLRRTVDFWATQRLNPGGDISYVATSSSGMTDSNPAVLIGAWAYVEISGDTKWLARRIELLERISRYTEKRDVDNDGLVESPGSGNRGAHSAPDTAWDTYTSGHKNALVNALAYRAWRGMAVLEARLGRADQAARFRKLADHLRAVYCDTFYNPESGWLGWWRSQDGFLHDINSDVPTCLGIMYGLVDLQRGKPMLDRYWAAMLRSGFSRFDLGLPLNIRPVPRDDEIGDWGGKKEDGSDTFGKYLNGGCVVSCTVMTLVANYMAGNVERADKLLDAMLKRQAEGVFPNGGGFQNGVVNAYPQGAEFYDWQGNTCGYEGHLVYSWSFLQAVLLREARYRQRVLGSLSP